MVDIDLPLLEAIPEEKACDYVATRKMLKYKPLSQQERNQLYNEDRPDGAANHPLSLPS
ncbi:hypothetical protein SAMN05216276_111315 [Streptosporangium subroseum]|uniref:Uncharacterized protein n=1 Tax=Streptosporangium subroseum TaxID=106412 RepID=A0A239PBC2_9ACTN|nr:hypothetical protein [Streptosporangium subroseum]SNT64232.1 hypothetical protein SAMN05216276_111315 [Streptosporangium subroseum]